MKIDIKKTVFSDVHLQNNAKIIEFASYSMPLSFTNFKYEHLTTRRSVGIFDVSHMAQFLISGDNASTFLDFLLSSGVLDMEVGSARYSLILNEFGFIKDDVYLYRLKNNEFLLVANAINREKIKNHINRLKLLSKLDFELEDLEEKQAILAIQGPNSRSALEKTLGFSISTKKNRFFTHDGITFANTGYTGEDGFEAFLPIDGALPFYNLLVDTMDKNKIEYANCGLAARNSLRFEAGYLLYDSEIDETVNPKEVLLTWACKGLNFFGRDAYLNLKKTRTLATVRMLESHVPRKNYELRNAHNEWIGSVLSGVFLPTLNGFYANVFVKSDITKHDFKDISIDIRGKLVKCEYVNRPIYKKKI